MDQPPLRLNRSLAAQGAVLPLAVRRALVIEAALWAGRLPLAFIAEMRHTGVVQPVPGPRPLGPARGGGSGPSALVASQAPLCAGMPAEAVADLFAAWEFLRCTALPLGLDAVLAQVR